MAKQKPIDPATLPKVDDEFTCASCGMVILVTADCGCDDDPSCAPSFTCCGKELCKSS